MPANDATLPAGLLREIIDYDPETGAMFWKPRRPEMFADSYRDAAGNCANWNAIYANQPALTAQQRKGYLGGTCLGFHVKAHRVAWAIATGNWPKHHIDHLNGDPKDNRIANLRDVTNHVNHLNVRMQVNNRSGRCGVRYTPKTGRWHARIKFQRRERYLGMFATFEEACEARAEAERELGFHPNHGKMRTDEVLRPPLGGL